MITNQQIILNNGEIGTIVSASFNSITLQVNGTRKTIDTKFVMNQGLLNKPNQEIIDELTIIYDNYSLNHPISKQASTNIKPGVRLYRCQKFSKCASQIYSKCCSAYNFDKTKYENLYAPKATVEGYSVYFINSSNLNNKSKNIIINNDYIKESIETYNKKALYNKLYKETRLVFAKDSLGYYRFLGLYQYYNIENNTIIFKKISNIYY